MPPVKVDPSACKNDGSMCFARGNCKEVQCSVCLQWVNPGTIRAPKFPAGDWTAWDPPPEKDYFCAYCHRLSRPAAWCCWCKEACEWYVAHGREIGELPVQTPPGPPAGIPPPGISAGPPGPPYANIASASSPSREIALPPPQPSYPNVEKVSAPSMFSKHSDQENLIQEVEHLRQEVADLRLKLSVLENIVQGLQKPSIMPE